MSMIVLDLVAKEIVAGVRLGAGADEVVCVNEVDERDLSRNSTIGCR
jgi:hypothetical protein